MLILNPAPPPRPNPDPSAVWNNLRCIEWLIQKHKRCFQNITQILWPSWLNFTRCSSGHCHNILRSVGERPSVMHFIHESVFMDSITPALPNTTKGFETSPPVHFSTWLMTFSFTLIRIQRRKEWRAQHLRHSRDMLVKKSLKVDYPVNPPNMALVCNNFLNMADSFKLLLIVHLTWEWPWYRSILTVCQRSFGERAFDIQLL